MKDYKKIAIVLAFTNATFITIHILYFYLLPRLKYNYSWKDRIWVEEKGEEEYRFFSYIFQISFLCITFDLVITAPTKYWFRFHEAKEEYVQPAKRIWL